MDESEKTALLAMAKKGIIENGDITPFIVMQTASNQKIVALVQIPYPGPQRKKMFFTMGLRASSMYGKVTGVYFATTAWMVSVKQEPGEEFDRANLPTNLEDHPDRQEILMIGFSDKSGSYEQLLWNIIRTDDGPVFQENESFQKGEGKIKSYLMDAFWAGEELGVMPMPEKRKFLSKIFDVDLTEDDVLKALNFLNEGTGFKPFNPVTGELGPDDEEPHDS